jgi:hypothetical protein
MMTQKDVIEQVQHTDAVAMGGWSLDLHPSDGIYTDKDPCNQYHSKGVYGIPYRCYFSRNIDNLLLAGRIMSASHVAFGSTRVMLTCGHGGAAVGMAAAHCIQKEFIPPGAYCIRAYASPARRIKCGGAGHPEYTDGSARESGSECCGFCELNLCTGCTTCKRSLEEFGKSCGPARSLADRLPSHDRV